MPAKYTLSIIIGWFSLPTVQMPFYEQAAQALIVQHSITSKDDCQLPANKENVFDSMGIQYYECMQLLEKQMANDSLGNFNTILIKYFYSKFSNRDSILQSINSSKTEINNIILDASNDYSNIIKARIDAASIQIYAAKLLDIIKGLSENGNPYCSIKKAIVAIEKNIQKDKWMNAAERKIILQACSIARYSVYYWQKKIVMTNEPVGKFKLFRYQAICLGTVATALVEKHNTGSIAACINSALASAMLYESTEPY